MRREDVTDLRSFITLLEEKGELKRIAAPVSAELEITEITDRVSKAGGPALLFENVDGSEMPVLINAFGSAERSAWALGAGSFAEIAARVEDLIDLQLPAGMVEKVKALGKLKDLAGFSAKTVKSGPCQEVVWEEPDLSRLPVLKCWPGDGGPFVTLPVIYTRDPDRGARNAGMYRLQVYDKATTGMHWHIHKDGAENFRRHRAAGKRMEVAVALGADPAVIYAATAPLPKGIDEMMFAGFLRNRAVDMVKCKTVDLEVPASSEIVLEGYVELDELRREGPFGDHTGYYSLADDYPVFHLTGMTSRREPIYATTIVGKPPMEDCYLAKATERIFLPLIRFQIPEIVDLNLPLEGVFHNCAMVSIRKRYPGQARKVMHALWGMGQMSFTKYIIVVDEHVDVQDQAEVWWRVYNNTDPKRDSEFARGPLDVLDHSSGHSRFGWKMGLDATKKLPEEGHEREWPEELKMDDAVRRSVDERWREFGL